MRVLSILLAAVAALALFGCSSMQSLADGVSQKSISTSGTVAYGRVGLSPTTATPEVLGLFVWGDYASVSPDSGEVLRYERTDDASVFNSASKTTRVKLFFASDDPARVDKVVEAITSNINKPPPTGEESL
jgi:hypothetical protein